MDSEKVKGSWDKLASKIKENFTYQTDDDLLFINVDEEELSKMRDQRIAKTKEELRKLISKS